MICGQSRLSSKKWHFPPRLARGRCKALHTSAPLDQDPAVLLRLLYAHRHVVENFFAPVAKVQSKTRGLLDVFVGADTTGGGDNQRELKEARNNGTRQIDMDSEGSRLRIGISRLVDRADWPRLTPQKDLLFAKPPTGMNPDRCRPTGFWS